jgi:hypothetical protein
MGIGKNVIFGAVNSEKSCQDDGVILVLLLSIDPSCP